MICCLGLLARTDEAALERLTYPRVPDRRRPHPETELEGEMKALSVALFELVS